MNREELEVKEMSKGVICGGALACVVFGLALMTANLGGMARWVGVSEALYFTSLAVLFLSVSLAQGKG
jgi:hypothetical protein